MPRPQPRSWPCCESVALSEIRVCGVDEVGRGPLAGPVVAAAVILDPQQPIAGLTDSKKLSEKKRQALELEIKQKALSWSIAEASVEEIDRLLGLELGADDYVCKPFSPRELLARIKAGTRRTSPADERGRLVVGVLALDTMSRRVLRDDEEVRLGPTEYRLLEFFMAHVGRAYSRSQILDNVWGTNAYLEERTVDVHIRRLRKALEPAGASHYLQTVRGHGYRFLAYQDN